MSAEKQEQGRILALDYGTVRIGVAVSDELGMLAHPRPYLPSNPSQRAIRLIRALVKSESIEGVLIGLPLNMNGTEGLSARKVRKFVSELAPQLSVPVEFIDERMTTVSAQRQLHESGKNTKSSRELIDSASAAVLLQAWLDGRGNAQ